MLKFWRAVAAGLLIVLILVPGIIHASTYSDAIVAAAPEAYYRLGESEGTSATDSSGNTHTGTYNAGVTLGASGAIQGDADTAVTLDGTDDYISLPGFSLQNQSFSIEAWIKAAASPPAQEAIFTAADSGFTDVVIMRVYSAGHLAVSYGGATIAASNVITFGSWHHVVYTYDYAGDESILYVDGTARANSDAGPYTAASVNYMNLGSTVGGDFFKGDLDEVAIYLSALAPEDIAAHYTTAGYSLSPTPTPTMTATQTLTPTPAPWLLATLPGSGQTYLIKYEIGLGEIFLGVISLIGLGLFILALVLKLILH